jgi:hypothetical protein
VHLVEVDVIDAEPGEARVEGLGEVLAGETQPVRVIRGREVSLGGDDQLVGESGVVGEPASDDALGLATAIDVCGLDEVAIGLDERVELFAGVGLVGLLAECHGAQAQAR